MSGAAAPLRSRFHGFPTVCSFHIKKLLLCDAGRDVLEIWGVQGIQTLFVSSLCSFLLPLLVLCWSFSPQSLTPSRRSAQRVPGEDKKESKRGFFSSSIPICGVPGAPKFRSDFPQELSLSHRSSSQVCSRRGWGREGGTSGMPQDGEGLGRFSGAARGGRAGRSGEFPEPAGSERSPGKAAPGIAWFQMRTKTCP